MIPARLHLQRVRIHWQDLEDALAAPNVSSWPPAGLSAHLSATAQRDDLEERWAQRAAERNPDQWGATAAPINLAVVDVMQQVTADLVECADHTAARVQRPAMSRAPRDWYPRDRALRNAAATRDAADPRRWQYVGTRTAVQAARWLDQRLTAEPGPFRPLPRLAVEQIARVAQQAAADVLRALELARQTRRLQHACPACRAPELTVKGGDGTDPAVHCQACGRVWRETVNA